MTDRPVDFKAWKCLIEKYLGKHCAKFTTKLACDVLLVDAGLKTSFLFDYACVSGDTLNNFVMGIRKEMLVKNKLIVAKVEEDIFICNLQMTRQRVEDLTIVDVSGNLKEPVLVDDRASNKILQAMVSEIEGCLEQNRSNSHLDIQLSEFVNRTTAFGYLLDYPVLYWYETNTGCDKNCLSMVPLKSVKVLAQFRTGDCNTKEHLAWSFSYPECFHEILRTRITTWFHKVIELCEKQTVIENVNLQEESVLLPHVAL